MAPDVDPGRPILVEAMADILRVTQQNLAASAVRRFDFWKHS